jgi:sulfide:quinone oxidoreductase
VFGGLLRDLDEGYTKKVAFVVPPGAYWPLPAYELALMTAWQAWGMGQNDVAVSVYTHEDAPLEAFGTEAAVALRQDCAEARVEVQTGVFAQEEDGRIVLQPGGRAIDAQRIIALPEALAPEVRGLPADARGFIPVDLHGKVTGTEAVWAAGDAIAFPVKQGGLAAQEADAAAEAIAALAGAAVEPRPFHPVLRGVVLTGRGRQWMRRDLESGAADVAQDTGTAERHALWWPPTKIAGRYLAPYLAALDQPEGGGQPPDGQPVELDVERLPGAADALALARMRTEPPPARH